MLVSPGIIVASIVTLASFAPGRKLLPLGSDLPGPRRVEGRRKAVDVKDSPRRFETGTTARPLVIVVDNARDALPDASPDPSRTVSTFWDTIENLKPASTAGFVRWMREHELYESYSWRTFYSLYSEFCELHNLRPLTERNLQNDLDRPEIDRRRPKGSIKNGTEHRPTFYAVKPPRKQRKAVA